MSFEIKENFNQDNPAQNIAICYKVKKGFEEKPKDLDTKNHIFFLNYDSKNKNGKQEIDIVNKNYRFCPIIESSSKENKQTTRMVIFGKGGSGKSVLVNRICEIFHSQNPDIPIYFLTNNNWKEDHELTHNIYTFLNLNKLLKKYSNAKEIDDFKNGANDGNIFNNSLIVFDDCQLNEDKKKKNLFYAFVNIILNHKRKSLIHFIFTTHDVSDGLYTRNLFTELTHYIFYTGSLLNRNNLILEKKLKLSSNEIRHMTDNDKTRWTCIMVDKKVVLTQNECYKLK